MGCAHDRPENRENQRGRDFALAIIILPIITDYHTLKNPAFGTSSSYKRNTGASCTGAVIYRAPAAGGGFPEKYHGALFYADFARKTVRSAPVDAATGKPGASEQFLMGLTAGPVALRLGPDGALYLVTHGGATLASTNDSIARIVWKP